MGLVSSKHVAANLSLVPAKVVVSVCELIYGRIRKIGAYLTTAPSMALRFREHLAVKSLSIVDFSLNIVDLSHFLVFEVDPSLVRILRRLNQLFRSCHGVWGPD